MRDDNRILETVGLWFFINLLLPSRRESRCDPDYFKQLVGTLLNPDDTYLVQTVAVG
jgi:hypothetical protein